MRDGVKLHTVILVPRGARKAGIVLTRTPYDANAMTRKAPSAHLGTVLAGLDRSGTLPTYDHPVDVLLEGGYIRVVQDVRGKGHSEGFYAAFVNDIEDGYDTVEAIASQPWSNGAVGMTGASAMGITSNLAAVAAPPHLKAAYVIVAPNESFNLDVMRKGIETAERILTAVAGA